MRDLHGGDIRQRNVRLDFSVNTNPFGMPEAVREVLISRIPEAERYPDPEYRELREALAENERRRIREGEEKKCEGQTGPAEDGGDLRIGWAQILVGNGASELIMAVAHAYAKERILLQQPLFSGYERAFAACGCEILRAEAGEDLELTQDVCRQILTEWPKLAVFCNPGNPTGALISPALFVRVEEACRKTGTVLLTDECFLDFVQDQHEHTAVRFFEKKGQCDKETKPGPAADLLILRAFTKLYAMPGVRLGYLVCSKAETAERIASHLPEWNVSVTAEAAGRTAILQKDYVRDTTELIRRERIRLDSALTELGYRTIPGEADFILFCSEKELWEPLLAKGILIRRCDNFAGITKQGCYRIAVRTHEENEELIRALRTL